MAYLGTKPANQVIDSTLIADGTITPADLSTGKPVWDTSGNVGIGTSSPAAKLSFGTYTDTTSTDVKTIRLYDDNVGVIYGFGVSTAQLNYRCGTSSDRHVWYAGTTERMRIDGSGNLGIGTSSPTQALDVNGNILGAASITIGTSGLYQAGSIYSDSNWGMLFRAKQASPVAADFMWANSAATERMRIDSSGTLLVGTTSLPASAGSAKIYSSNSIAASVGFYCKAGAAAATFGNQFNINWTGSPQLWIDSTNIGTIAFTSDYRIKRNIETQTTPALERVMALRPVTYQMADYKDGLFKATEDIKEGFIAHEVQEVIPSGAEGVKDDENQIQSLRVDAILAVAVKAIQEQQAIITSQADTISAMEARLTALESK